MSVRPQLADYVPATSRCIALRYFEGLQEDKSFGSGSLDGRKHSIGVRSKGCIASQTSPGTGASFSNLAIVQCAECAAEVGVFPSYLVTRPVCATSVGIIYRGRARHP